MGILIDSWNMFFKGKAIIIFLVIFRSSLLKNAWNHSQYRFAYYLQKLHNEFHPRVFVDYAILFLKSEENIFSWNQFDEFLHEEFRQRLTLNNLNSNPEKS